MKIKCLNCNDIIESLSIHDFKYCKCCSCSIDGRNEYTRVEEGFDYIHWVYDDEHEEKINVKIINNILKRAYNIKNVQFT